MLQSETATAIIYQKVEQYSAIKHLIDYVELYPNCFIPKKEE